MRGQILLQRRDVIGLYLSSLHIATSGHAAPPILFTLYSGKWWQHRGWVLKLGLPNKNLPNLNVRQFRLCKDSNWAEKRTGLQLKSLQKKLGWWFVWTHRGWDDHFLVRLEYFPLKNGQSQKCNELISQSLAQSRFFWLQCETKKSSCHPFDNKIYRMRSSEIKPTNFDVFAQKENVFVLLKSHLVPVIFPYFVVLAS